jgi:predicted nucleic acid-binding protein
LEIILDTSILIAAERRREAPEDILRRIMAAFGAVETAISTITVAEITHGIYRASTDEHRNRRLKFSESAFRILVTIPVSFEIAQLAGKIEGQQAAKGIVVPIADCSSAQQPSTTAIR